MKQNFEEKTVGKGYLGKYENVIKKNSVRIKKGKLNVRWSLKER